MDTLWYCIHMFFWKASSRVSADEGKINELLTRSVEEIIPSRDSLAALLRRGEPLRVKLGIDPTSPHLHIGRAVTLLKLRDFQELGHTVVFIVGDFTGLIGDTSDKESERPMLDAAVIEKNKEKYFEQAGKILDLSTVELRYNSEWLAKLNYRDVGEHADQFSVSDFISRELIRKRLDEGSRVSLRELLYPLMQGYDSVAVKADVEIGGSDQRFNLLAGRTLQSHYKQTPQHVCITGPLLLGTDGRKMSSSWGNTINLDEPPDEIFGKIMSIPDSLVEPYFTHVTRIPLAAIIEEVSGHPKDAKMALAHEIVRMYHGASAADKARHTFEHTFSKGEAPEDVRTVSLTSGTLADALVASGIVSSKMDFRRLLDAGAISVVLSGEKITEARQPEDGEVLRVGKHRFVKIVKT